MTDYRELLIGCGHARDKRIHTKRGGGDWLGLVTLDQNESVRPDFLCLIDHSAPWQIYKQSTNPLCDGLRESEMFLTDVKYYAPQFKESIFDEVHAYEVLEHLGDQGDAVAFFNQFAEIWRILKPGGVFCATVPSRYSPWLWGDPSHRRAILPESLVFLDQSEYVKQLDGKRPSSMSDFRSIYRADFKSLAMADNRATFSFMLEAVKPSRWTRERKA